MKKQVVIDALRANPTASYADIARIAGVSREYARQVAEDAGLTSQRQRVITRLCSILKLRQIRRENV